MLVIRPLQESDLDDLYTMAQNAGKGLTTLPADRELLQKKITHARETFNQRVAPEAGLYLFALEDTQSKKTVGISGIQARVGLDEVFYNYRLSVTVNASKELGVHVRTPTLHLSNDMTDTSEICSLLLSDDYKGGGNGLLLSRSRFMYLDEFRQHFSEKVFAEMRGVSDAEGRSPLWDALGSKFFDMEFTEADVLSGLGNKSFIAELMPKYPIYLPMLPDSARAVISSGPSAGVLYQRGTNPQRMARRCRVPASLVTVARREMLAWKVSPARIRSWPRATASRGSNTSRHRTRTPRSRRRFA